MFFTLNDRTMKKIFTSLAFSLLFFFSQAAPTPILIEVDTEGDNKAISPYLYGRNGAPKNATEINLIKESGIRFERMGNGNNCTKYNWKKNITCHPDWYNNVYGTDNWEKSALSMQENLPGVQGMFAFQLLGKVAKTDEYNFNDWEYNKSQWWSGCSENMCGGGTFDENGNVVSHGDTSLYLQDWPADSTVAIYKHWEENLKLDMSQFQYWNMDNEMEIWGLTHKDVAPSVYTDEYYEEIMQKYFAVAKAARAINPDIKLCGPNAANEWFWFTGAGNVQPTYNGKKYCWLEYFIMRCAEEEKRTGIRMIDVFDLHFYPEDTSEKTMLQTHRVFFDKSYSYPKANGLKTINGGWENNLREEYIMERCREWFVQYFGSENGITFGIGEFNLKSSASNMVHALSYASLIGEGSRQGMEYITPWTWYNSMWEVVHLYSRFAQEINVAAVSENESLLSAYTSINQGRDSITVILVNRSPDQSFSPSIRLSHSIIQNGTYPCYQLAGLPETQTFKSREDNALKELEVQVSNNVVGGVEIPPYSITAITLHGATNDVSEIEQNFLTLHPNPVEEELQISHDYVIQSVELINGEGKTVMQKSLNSQQVSINVEQLASGLYIVRCTLANGAKISQSIIKK